MKRRIEAKPPWTAVPPAVRQAVRETLGAPVQRGMRVWGGYTPTPTFRLRLADGRLAFFKADGPDADEFTRALLRREQRVYRELGEWIGCWAPTPLGAFERAGWLVQLLEDLGPAGRSAWAPGLTRRVVEALADFHRSSRGAALPGWLSRPTDDPVAVQRRWVWADDPAGLASLAALAGDLADPARRWLAEAVPRLRAISRDSLGAEADFVLLHGDTRSDNLRWRRGRLYLLDWAFVCVGPAESDLVTFAQAVATEGGPSPEQVVRWYERRAPVRPAVLDATLAGLAGYFAHRAWQPPLAGSPRLRPFQRRQLRSTLAWAARRFALPEPQWLRGISD